MAEADGLVEVDGVGQPAVAAEGEAAGTEGAGERDGGEEDTAADAVAAEVFGDGHLGEFELALVLRMRAQQPTGRVPAKAMRMWPPGPRMLRCGSPRLRWSRSSIPKYLEIHCSLRAKKAAASAGWKGRISMGEAGAVLGGWTAAAVWDISDLLDSSLQGDQRDVQYLFMRIRMLLPLRGVMVRSEIELAFRTGEERAVVAAFAQLARRVFRAGGEGAGRASPGV